MLITFPVLGILFNHYPRVSGRRNEQGRQNVSPNTVTETAENLVNSIDQAFSSYRQEIRKQYEA